MVSLSAFTQGRVRNADPLQTGTQTTALCEQEENNGLLGLLQSLNWVKVWLKTIIAFLPVSFEL